MGTVLVSVLCVGLIVFCGFPTIVRGYPLEFLCVPVLLWTAFRLGRPTTAVAILILAALAVAGTLSGYGPFQRSTPTTSLMLVLAFMCLMAVMTFALASLAAEYSVAEAQLRELVVTDPLTGLPNYRRLIDVLGTEITKSNRDNTPFAVVFFDMDGLKRINDELGHLIGSRAVCRFAETLKASCRGTDSPGTARRGSRQARTGGQRRHCGVSPRRRHAHDPAELRRPRAVRRESEQGPRPAPSRRRHRRLAVGLPESVAADANLTSEPAGSGRGRARLPYALPWHAKCIFERPAPSQADGPLRTGRA
jgi:hypothetical protein